MPEIKGSCLCGAVRYHSDAEPVLAAICNCKNCQRQSGSAYSVVVALPKGSIVMDAAVPDTFDDVGETGMAVRRRFCSSCGSPIFSEVDSTPELDYLKAGTLDDTSWLEPQVNIWCDSEQHWLQKDLSPQRVPRNPS